MVDLFSGGDTASAAMKEEAGWVVEKVDLSNGKDVMKWDHRPFIGADLVWASPPCECFSVASCYRHWRKVGPRYIPQDERTEEALELMWRTFELVELLRPRYYVIENPRGMMRRLAPRRPNVTVWYCRFGDRRAKPTDLWTNIKGWPRPCRPKNMACHHDKCPRGTSRGGTQDLSKSYLSRSAIPFKLSEFVAKKVIEGQQARDKGWVAGGEHEISIC